MSKWFVVETECNGERHFHWVFTRTANGAASEAREREFQSWSGNHVVKVIRTDMQV